MSPDRSVRRAYAGVSGCGGVSGVDLAECPATLGRLLVDWVPLYSSNTFTPPGHVCLSQLLSTTLNFTGSSRPRRSKVPVTRGRRNPPRDQSNRRRLRHLQYDYEKDVYVDPSAITQGAC